MSLNASKAVWQMDLPSTEKLVALRIADLVRDDCVFFGSVAGIAEATGLNAGTVRRAIRRLEDRGLLEFVSAEPGKPAVYNLCISAHNLGISDVTPRTERAPVIHNPAHRARGGRAERAGTPRAARAKPLLTVKEPYIAPVEKLATHLLTIFEYHRPTSPTPSKDIQATEQLVRAAQTAPRPEQAIELIPTVLRFALTDPFWARTVHNLKSFAHVYPRIVAATPAAPLPPTEIRDCHECDNRRMIETDTPTGLVVHQCGCVELAHQ